MVKKCLDQSVICVYKKHKVMDVLVIKKRKKEMHIFLANGWLLLLMHKFIPSSSVIILKTHTGYSYHCWWQQAHIHLLFPKMLLHVVLVY